MKRIPIVSAGSIMENKIVMLRPGDGTKISSTSWSFLWLLFAPNLSAYSNALWHLAATLNAGGFFTSSHRYRGIVLVFPIIPRLSKLR